MAGRVRISKKTDGLRDYTDREIADRIAKLRSEGYTVEHVTRTKSGKALPYNGVLKYWRN